MDISIGTFIGLFLLLLIVVMILASIKIVNTGSVLLVERFGQFHRILQPGWHLTIVFADFVRRKISTKQQILDIQPQNVITKDNVNISIDNVIFYKVTDSRDAVYNIEDYKSGIVYSTITNMRNIVGDMTLDDVLSGRDRINSRLLEIIDDITDAYGIKILSVEIKNIVPPTEIQNAMEKQMRAERDKRAFILTAEGEKQSQIERAEGHKQAQILNAEAEKQATIRRAEGLKESQLLEAEGKAKAIEAIAIAEAEAIRKINTAIIESGTNETVIALKQIEALKEMAKGPANKLILPNETLSSLGSIAAIAEMLKMNKNNENITLENKLTKSDEIENKLK
ncbi:MAG: SPFH domain-containing protein [Clostridium sp.]|uniref:SPFH domain-containing protein n=1 Tax=Clostridium sp. TaxID=1506 RepID=UPI003D6CB7F1